MSGAIALVAAFLAFMVPIAIPLFAQSWRTFGIVIALGLLFFTWATIDVANPAGITQALGTFVLGLALFGFAAGVIAKFVMLVGRRQASSATSERSSLQPHHVTLCTTASCCSRDHAYILFAYDADDGRAGLCPGEAEGRRRRARRGRLMSALYDDPEAFFSRHGMSTFLTLDAAARACELASDRNLVVYRVEGGKWRNPGFEARIDAIWDGKMPPLSPAQARLNNERAAEMIVSDNEGCDTFVLSVKPNDSAVVT